MFGECLPLFCLLGLQPIDITEDVLVVSPVASCGLALASNATRASEARGLKRFARLVDYSGAH